MLVFSYRGDTGTYSLYGVYVSAVKTDQELFQNKTKMKSCLYKGRGGVSRSHGWCEEQVMDYRVGFCFWLDWRGTYQRLFLKQEFRKEGIEDYK